MEGTNLSKQTINFASYNIEHGLSCGLDVSILGKDIKDMNLDIVGIQEVDEFVPRSNLIDTMDILSKSASMPYYKFFKAIDLHGGEYGVGILSKFPILESDYIEFETYGHENRVCGRCLIDMGTQKINFFVTHLSFESPQLREEQFNALLNHVKNYDRVVISGDFNTDNLSEYNIMRKGNFDFINSEDDYVNTFPPSCCIDNLIYSKEFWNFGKPFVLQNNHSDHYMLYAKAELIK